MFNVWSVCWGQKYTPNDVIRLKRMVAEHLSIPHNFFCLTDKNIPGVNTARTISTKPGWWQKLDLFSVAYGDCLYIDLDTVITGDLSEFPDFISKGRITMPRNWAQSGHGGFQSSVMLWHGPMRRVTDSCLQRCIGKPDDNNHGLYNCGHGPLWGDQEFLYAFWKHLIIELPIGQVCSYKYHCQNIKPDGTYSPPPDCKIVAFHGNPKPNEVNDGWVKSTL